MSTFSKAMSAFSLAPKLCARRTPSRNRTCSCHRSCRRDASGSGRRSSFLGPWELWWGTVGSWEKKGKEWMVDSFV